jgi:hypothetical protein
MSAEPARDAARAPEVVLDVESRSGAFVLVLANTGTSTAFEPRVSFDAELTGMRGELIISDLPLWTGLAMLRPGCQIDVLLDATHGQRAREHRRFTATVTYRDGTGGSFERAYTHDLQAYDGLPTLLA